MSDSRQHNHAYPRSKAPSAFSKRQHKDLVGYVPPETSDEERQHRVDALLSVGVARENIVTPSWVSERRRSAILAKVITQLARGSTLVVCRLSDLGSSVSRITMMSRKALKRGASIRLACPRLDLCSPDDDSLLEALETFDKDQHRRRTREGLAAAREKGRIGGKRHAFTDQQIREAIEAVDVQKRPVEDVAASLVNKRGRAISASWLKRRMREVKQKDGAAV